MKTKDGPPPSGAVSQALADFKRRGCSLLIVGPACTSHLDVCTRLLGSGSNDGRCVFVRTDGTATPSDRGIDDPSHVITRSTPVRSTSAVASVDTSAFDADGLTRELRAAVEAAAIDTDPADLRVCLDSLRPLVELLDREELDAFLEELDGLARDPGAVVHTHLPTISGATSESLAESFDAVVEVTSRTDGTYQRWQLPGDVTSEWVRI